MNAQIAYAPDGEVIPVWTFADRLRKARSIAGMDQRTFASHIQCTSSALAQWEANNSRPRDIVEVARRVEAVTHIPASWLLDINGTGPGMRKASDRGRSEASWLPDLDSNQEPAVYWLECPMIEDDEADLDGPLAPVLPFVRAS